MGESRIYSILIHWVTSAHSEALIHTPAAASALPDIYIYVIRNVQQNCLSAIYREVGKQQAGSHAPSGTDDPWHRPQK